VITLTKEEAQQVLDALQEMNKLSIGENAICLPAEIDDAMETLRARLAQPEPEPVAWMRLDKGHLDFHKHPQYEPLYTAPPQPEPKPVADKYLMEVECTKCGAKQDGILTVNAPPQREWQGLTDEEISELIRNTHNTGSFVRAIEAKLKEKNNG